MARWQLIGGPAGPGGPLTGSYSDEDACLRLRCLVDMLTKAEASVREAQRALNADLAAASRNGQQAIADEALRLLAERRARAVEG